MELHLSQNSITHTILCASPPGRPNSLTPLYHIYTPEGTFRGPTTVSYISPSIAHDSSYKSSSRKKSDIKTGKRYKGGVQEFARIRLRTFRGSRVDYEGRSMKESDLLRSAGFWSSARKFTAPDGHAYTWRKGRLVVKKNGSEIEVARFHDSFGGFFSGVTLPYLEIWQEGMHIVDLIVMTWVFVARGKREEDRASVVEGVQGAVDIAEVLYGQIS